MKSCCVTIQMKTTDQYSHVVLSLMLHKVALIKSLSMKLWSVNIQMKASEQK